MAQLSFYKTLFSSVRECYERDLYCDVKLFARVDSDQGLDNSEPSSGDYGDPANLRAVQCHSLVLCSVAPTFKVCGISYFPMKGFTDPPPSFAKNILGKD